MIGRCFNCRKRVRHASYIGMERIIAYSNIGLYAVYVNEYKRMDSCRETGRFSR